MIMINSKYILCALTVLIWMPTQSSLACTAQTQRSLPFNWQESLSKQQVYELKHKQWSSLPSGGEESLNEQQASELKYKKWTQESWTGDERSEEAVTNEIDKQITSGRSPDEILTVYRERALDTAKLGSFSVSPLALYGWAYAAWKTATPSIWKTELAKNLVGLDAAFKASGSLHTYSFARLRFLTANFPIARPSLRELGARLLKHSSHDYFVKRDMIIFDIIARNSASIPQAIRDTQELINEHPERWSLYAILGWAYEFSEAYDGVRSDGPKAIAAYQTYMRLGPHVPGAYDDVQYAIERVQKDMAKPH